MSFIRLGLQIPFLIKYIYRFNIPAFGIWSYKISLAFQESIVITHRFLPDQYVAYVYEDPLSSVSPRSVSCIFDII